MNFIKHAKYAYITVSAIMTVFGIAMIAFPSIAADTFCIIAGILLAVFGIVKLFGYFCKDIFRLAFQFDLALGIFLLIAGVLFLAAPDAIEHALPAVIGIFIIIDGAFKAQTAADAKKFGFEHWWLILALALLTCVIGVLLTLNPFSGAHALMVLIGVTLITDGLQNLCVVAYTVNTAARFKPTKDID